MAAEASSEEGGVSYVGALDVVILVSIILAVFFVVRRFWKKKQQEKDNLRNFMVVPK